MGSAEIPATKEPSGLVRQDGKRPDGLTLIPWQGGKSLAWDVTVVSTLAQSYVDRAATGVGVVAEMAAERKLAKYSNLASNFIFQPTAVENLGAFSLSNWSSWVISVTSSAVSLVRSERHHFCSNVCRCRCSVLIVLFHETFVIDDVPDQSNPIQSNEVWRAQVEPLYPHLQQQ